MAAIFVVKVRLRNVENLLATKDLQKAKSLITNIANAAKWDSQTSQLATSLLPTQVVEEGTFFNSEGRAAGWYWIYEVSNLDKI